jgi:hypothetical protein
MVIYCHFGMAEKPNSLALHEEKLPYIPIVLQLALVKFRKVLVLLL